MKWATSNVVIILACLPALAGCIGEDPEPASIEAPIAPATGIDWDMLSEATYDVLPKTIEYVAAALDGIQLYVEVYLPDGEGPWPTILQNSPYYGTGNIGRTPGFDAFSNTPSLASNYAARGYAVVFADVRGTGNSEGCMDMMGAKEQADTYDLVEWVAAQPWSDGHVGMQGVSYVGTTPHEAMIMAPPHLDAVATVAGVTNQWRNVYQNGVPYTGRAYPLLYEAGWGATPPMDVARGADWALNVAAGGCDQVEPVQEMAPGTYEKGVYSSYWHERNFTQHAANVTTPILYSQGFVDRAVNPMEAVHWFNDLAGPKKGFFHQGGHQYAPREDYFDTELAWFDYWLKGIDNGIMNSTTVEVQLNNDLIRTGDTWPPTDATATRFFLAPGELTSNTPGEGSETYAAGAATLDDVHLGALEATEAATREAAYGPSHLEWISAPVENDMHLAGSARLHLNASVDADNTYFIFDLYDVNPDGRFQWLAEGWFNAHLREGFDHIAPLTPGEAYAFDFAFEPREYVIEAGHSIGLRVAGASLDVAPYDEVLTQNTLLYGAEGSWLELPVMDAPAVFAAPKAVTG